MMLTLFLFTLLNFAGVVYLVCLFYQKYRQTPTKTVPPVSTRGLKINLVRFNPFNDLGGDQSFILCLLDNQNSGAIITSLHSRHHTRLYAKSIKLGKVGEGHLSPEENQVLVKTIKGHETKN